MLAPWTSKPPLGAQIARLPAHGHAFFHALDLRLSARSAVATNVVERHGYGATGSNGHFFINKSQWVNSGAGIISATFYYPAGKSGYLWCAYQDWSDSRYYRCYVSTTGIVTYQWSNTAHTPTGGALSSSVALTPNAANTVQVVSTGAGKQIYINGQLSLDASTGGSSCWLDAAQATMGSQYYGVRFGGDFRFGISVYSNIWFESFGVTSLAALPELIHYGANPWQVYQPPRRLGPSAGGDGTPWTVAHDLQSTIVTSLAVTHDLKATIAASLVTVADLLATINTAVATAHDSKATVMTSLTTAHDLSAAISSPWSATHDARAIVATAITTLHDTLADISQLVGYVINHDTRLEVATALATPHDTQSAVSMAGVLTHDARATIATAIATVADTLVDVSALVGYVVHHDTRLVVSTEIALAHDALVRISSEIATAHDTRVVVQLLEDASAVVGNIIVLMAEQRVIVMSQEQRIIRLPA